MIEPSLSRRQWLGAAALGSGLIVARGSRAIAASPAPSSPAADEALQRLLKGNQRFVHGTTKNPRRAPADFRALAEGQRPVAVIMGCADSRVPPELLFDQGVGDLFVVRVAGNVVGGGGVFVKGSIEYAVAELGVRLIMVLGHSSCGAVKAAIKHVDDGDPLPGAIAELVNRIRPAVIKAKDMPGDRLANAISANVLLGVETLNNLDPIVRPAVSSGQAKVVGAVYDLRTGAVTLSG
ncbi:MAG TPA: carbonic anhydrase [Methylomirabilota bacterium]|nr:carbonic anhydrase [Methylomirabilota bacterium]